MSLKGTVSASAARPSKFEGLRKRLGFSFMRRSIGVAIGVAIGVVFNATYAIHRAENIKMLTQ